MRVLIVFIVNGEDVPVEVNPHEPLLAAVNQALEQSKNTGRPPSDWEVRDINGGLIAELHRSVADLGFVSGVRLFLSLKVGAGGADAG